jgi:hypothetical protein
VAIATAFLILPSTAPSAKTSIASEPEFRVVESVGPGGIGQYTIINNSDEAGYTPESTAADGKGLDELAAFQWANGLICPP